VPKVSVLMAVYNCERYLPQAIDSILNQTYSNFEFLIVNDGSTDNTGDILARYADRDQRIIVIRNEANVGLTQSLNRGLEIAQGKYIARMDADDVSLPERFALQVRYLEQHPEIGVLGANVVYIDADGRTMYRGRPRPKDIRPASPDVIKWTLLWRCPISNVMARRAVFERTGLTYDPEFKTTQDRDLYTRLSKYTVVARLTEATVYLRVHPASISCTRREEQRAMTHAITRRELTTLLDGVSSEEAMETLISVFTRHNLGAHRDFVGAADLLFQACWRFCQQPLSQADRRRIEEDVAWRMLVIGREAALHSPGAALQVLWRLRYLSLGPLLSIGTARGVAGVFLRTIGLRRPAKPDPSQSAIGGQGD